MTTRREHDEELWREQYLRLDPKDALNSEGVRQALREWLQNQILMSTFNLEGNGYPVSAETWVYELPTRERIEANILLEARATLEHLEAGDAWRAAWHAVELGRWLSRQKMAPRAPDARAGRGTRQGGHKGHVKVYGTRTEREQSYARWQCAVEAEFDAAPAAGWYDACQIVADRARVHVKTILRHTQNTRTPKKR